MELIEWILQDENINGAIKSVKKNKGAYGIDKMSVGELDEYFATHREEIKSQIRDGKYKSTPVRRVYIPKSKRRDLSEYQPLWTEWYNKRQHKSCLLAMTSTSQNTATDSAPAGAVNRQ